MPPHLVLQIILLGFAWIVAAMISVTTYVKWQEMQTMRAWPVTPGRITSFRVGRREVARSSGSDRTRGLTETRNSRHRLQTQGQRPHFVEHAVQHGN